jgi:hypothetical protein
LTASDGCGVSLFDAQRGRERAGNWIIAAQKHFQEYKAHRDLYHYAATILAGKAGRLLNALRGTEVISDINELHPIAADLGILPHELRDSVLPLLERVTGGRVEGIYDGGNIVGVREYPITKGQILTATHDMWDTSGPTTVERIALESLEVCSRIPRAASEYTEVLTHLGYTEEQVELASQLQESFALVRKVRLQGMGEDVLYAEYVWRENAHRVVHALRTLEYAGKQAVLDMIERIIDQQGYPIRFVDGVPSHVLELARRVGLIDVVRVTSTTKREEGFAFTPAMVGSLPSKELEQDHHDDVKAFLASIRFGMSFASGSALTAPIRFLEKLVENREAGAAPAIGRDYLLPERRKIIKVVRVPGRYGQTFGMKLLKPDVVQTALEVLRYGQALALPQDAAAGARLDPASFVSPEGDRIRVGETELARAPTGSTLADTLFQEVLRGER